MHSTSSQLFSVNAAAFCFTLHSDYMCVFWLHRREFTASTILKTWLFLAQSSKFQYFVIGQEEGFLLDS